MTLPSAFNRDNNFNAIRLIAAIAVLVSHGFALATGDPFSEPLRSSLGITWGSIAVDVFFVASGFLIALSAQRSAGPVDFAISRMLRIFPALIFSVFVTALFLGPIVTTQSIQEYFFDSRTVKYVLKNSIAVFGVSDSLPGVFLSNPFPRAVNGSLWTLPYEMRCYFALGVVYFLLRHLGVDSERWRSVALIFGVLALSVNLASAVDLIEMPKYAHLGAMFAIGAAMEANRDRFAFDDRIAIALAMILVGSAWLAESAGYLFKFIYAISLPYITISLATAAWSSLAVINRGSDVSYGVYIYAFPVQQVLALSMPGIRPPMMIALSFVLTFIIAAISWRFIEAPALRLKSKIIHRDLK